jgi:hypothetical protein
MSNYLIKIDIGVRNMAKYNLYVRDQYFNRVAEIENYQSLTLKPQFNLVGTWALTLPFNCPAAFELIKPKTGIIVVRDGITIFSGPVMQKQRKWSKDEDMLTINGYDDNVVLQHFIALPTQVGPPYDADYDVRTGPAETVMKQYVDANIVSGAQSNRKQNITIETDQGRGSSVKGNARFNTLLDLCGTLALAGGGLGFKIVQNGNALQFQVYQPTDKTKSVIFSPLLGNLIDFDYTETAPQANYIIAGGTGQGASRTTQESGDSDSIVTYGRIEEFLDQRDTTDPTQLQQAISAELSQKANQTNLSMTATDTDGMAFVRNYNLGDKVTVILTQPDVVNEIDELTSFISLYQTEMITVERLREVQTVANVITDVIRQVTITIDQSGETINPVIGSPDSTVRPGLNIFTKIKQINKRLINLERV